jgi:Uma2 family endonuclease
MTQAVQQRFTFNEWSIYNDGSDTRYELVDGELKPMSLGTGQHGRITKFLEKALDAEIARLGWQWTAERFSIGVQSPRGSRWDTGRIPDVVVVTLQQWEQLQKREAVIALNEPPPILVMEVISPSTALEDYRAKLAEYCVLDIGEYWIVDPLEAKVTVGTLQNGLYDLEEFRGDDRIGSLTFTELHLTANQIFATGRQNT